MPELPIFDAPVVAGGKPWQWKSCEDIAVSGMHLSGMDLGISFRIVGRLNNKHGMVFIFLWKHIGCGHVYYQVMNVRGNVLETEDSEKLALYMGAKVDIFRIRLRELNLSPCTVCSGQTQGGTSLDVVVAHQVGYKLIDSSEEVAV